jgi:hypothetical protein
MKFSRLSIAAAFLACATGPASAAIINAALSATDFGAPSAFAFSFSTPYVGGPYNTSILQYELTLTDGGRDGATLTGTVEGLVDGNLASTLTLNCSVPFDGVTQNGFKVCSGSISNPFAAPAAGMLQLDIQFQLSGDGDSVSMAASHEIKNVDSTVPEPSAVILGATGLGLLALLRRWRG